MQSKVSKVEPRRIFFLDLKKCQIYLRVQQPMPEGADEDEFLESLVEMVDEMRDAVEDVAGFWRGLGLDFDEDVQVNAAAPAPSQAAAAAAAGTSSNAAPTGDAVPPAGAAVRPPAILPPRAYSDSAAMNQRAHEVLASNWEEQRGKLQGELDMNAQRLKAAEHCEAQRLPQNSEMAAMLQRNAEALRQHNQATFVRPLKALPGDLRPLLSSIFSDGDLAAAELPAAEGTAKGEGDSASVRVDLLRFLVSQGEKEDPEVEFYFVPRDVVLGFDGGADGGSLPRFQALRDAYQLIKFKVSLRGAVRGEYAGKFGVASHRWEDPAVPDASGEQLKKIQAHLRENPAIEYYWYDYWCMPQAAFDDAKDPETGELVHRDGKREDRSPDELAEFDIMLKHVNALYLGMQVLLIMDLSYVSRFWTQFEAWLSMQRTTDQGLSSAVGSPSELRYEVVGVLNAKTDIQRLQIEDMWGTATPEEAHDKLKRNDVTVTNQKDKEFFLPKIKAINRAVMLAFYSSLAAEELLQSRD